MGLKIEKLNFSVPTNKYKEIGKRMAEENYFDDMSEYFHYAISVHLTDIGKFGEWEEAEDRAKELFSIYERFSESAEIREDFYEFTADKDYEDPVNVSELARFAEETDMIDESIEGFYVKLGSKE